MFKKFIDYRVSEKTEIAHAAIVTIVGTVVVAILLVLSAYLDFLRPTVTVDVAGKLETVKDHWYLARSLMLKTVGALVGGMVLGWSVLIFNHITPTDYLLSAGRNPLASGIVIGAFLFAMYGMWCWG